MKVRAKREMMYMSRMLRAGDEFEATLVDGRYMVGDGSVEAVDDGEQGQPRHGRLAHQTAPEAPAAAGPDEPEDEFHGKTVTELREMAEARGLELQSGYMRRDELIALLRGE